jgi:hypothetical protein
MTKILSKAVALIFHPLFIIGFGLLFLMCANPYLFGFQGPKAEGLVVISVLTISIMFPLIAILMMKALNLIQSLSMVEKSERIGPLIATGLFYMWLYMNVRNNDTIPAALSFFILGATIAIFLALLINSFTKISLHTIGSGGLFAGILFMIHEWSYGQITLRIPWTFVSIEISDLMIMVIVTLIAGLVGSSRLHLKSHEPVEVYGGYFVGIVAQIFAFRIFFN